MSPISSCTCVSSGPGSSVVDSRSLTRSPGAPSSRGRDPTRRSPRTTVRSTSGANVRVHNGATRRSGPGRRMSSAEKARSMPRWFSVTTMPTRGTSRIAWTSRSYCDGSSSEKTDSSNTARGRKSSPANTTLRPRLFHAHRPSSATTRPMPCGCELWTRLSGYASTSTTAHSTRSSAARTSSGWTDWRQRAPTGHVGGCQRNPRRSTTALYARAPRRPRCTRRRSDRPRRHARAATGGSRTRACGRS